MDAVIKIGGSLAENPATLKTLCHKLNGIAKEHCIAVVPGGGKFADTVREFDNNYSLPADTAHKMAILAMDQFGLLLSQLVPNSVATCSLTEASQLSKNKATPIFLPSRLFFTEKPLHASWDVTSDSIAAYVASRLKADKLVLVTDVDGIFTSDPKTHSDAKLLPKLSPSELLAFAQRTSVDKFLPKFLSTKRLNCYVVNGTYPERVSAILAGNSAVCTLIKAEVKAK
ncbi:MAG: delta 1-pyrroline-5-carboxylate synthetase [Candidatus Bathyarchaeota archaeon]|nr:delta 1-pyrroline-5-carboxylate synthetase [Candidatus Bathyarchaeota archaeon]